MDDESEKQYLIIQDEPEPNVSQITNRRNLCLLAIKVCCSRYFLKALLLGQFISLLLCGTAVSTGFLQERGVNIPTAQSFFNYVLLCVVFTTILSCRKQGRSLKEVMKSWGWKYALIAVVDVEANYLVVKAYAYTTVTSVQLLDCFSLVSVMILSRLCLGARYRAQHLIGAAVCLLGMTGLVLTDVLVGKNDNSASNVALGDVLIIVGASLYGVSNVCEEYVVRMYDKVEFLAMVGLFGSFVNGIQFAILERDEIATLDLTSYETVIPLVVFVVCLFTLYSCMTVVIQLTSATAVNLSILSADFYTLLFGLFLFNYKGIILGVAIYSMTEISPLLQQETSLGQPGECSTSENLSADTCKGNSLGHPGGCGTRENLSADTCKGNSLGHPGECGTSENLSADTCKGNSLGHPGECGTSENLSADTCKGNSLGHPGECDTR